MKNRIITLSFREITKSYKRFLSLLVISFLGVSIFVGMRTAPNTLLSSLDKYYDKNNVYDVKIVSTLGLTDNDISELKKLKLIEDAYGVHSKDVYLYAEEKNYVLKLVGLNNNINNSLIIEGRAPKEKNEIAVEENVITTLNLNIGDKITISEENTLTTAEFEIVGVCINPAYLLAGNPSLMRGTTNIGAGQVNFYSYVTDDIFNMDYYTEIYLTVKDAKKKITDSDEYNELIDSAIKEVNKIKRTQEEQRYNAIYDEAMAEINSNESTANNKLKKAKSKLNKANKELKEGYSELDDNQSKLNYAKEELNKSEQELKTAKKEIDSGEKKLTEAKKEIAEGKATINDELSQYKLEYEDIVTIRKILNGQEVTRESFKAIIDENSQYANSYYQVVDYLYDNNYDKTITNFFKTGGSEYKEKIINAIPLNTPNYDSVVSYINSIDPNEVKEYVMTDILSDKPINELKKYIPEGIKNHDKIIDYLDDKANTINNVKTLFNAVKNIEEGEKEVTANETKLIEAKKEYEDGYKTYLSYKSELEESEKELNQGYDTYYSGLKEYNKNKRKFDINKIDVEKKLEEAKNDINALEVPTWYINSRIDNSDYSSFINVGQSIKKLSLTFPVVFYIVAIFMSTMSMSRMAMEDRTEIGSLKSMGFSNIHIMLKYITYSSFATLIGGILGSIFGFTYLSYFVWKMYHIIFEVEEFKYYFNIMPFIVGILLSFASITGVAVLTVKSIVKENAAALLRPKAPASGKKMFIEKLRIWRHINFSNKITIRNIIRYRKRVIMTVIGIAGCTVLLITGYGIKDAIVNITSKQYSEVQVFDDIVYLDGKETNVDELFSNELIESKLNLKLLSGYVGIDSVNLNAFNPEDNKNGILNLFSEKTGNKIELKKGKVVVSSKLAHMHNLNIGDKVTFTDNDNNEYKMTISDINKNYIGHHIYMDNQTYEDIFGEYDINMSYLKFKTTEDENKVIAGIIENEHTMAVVNIEYTKQTVNNMVKSLDSVVFILIVFSGILSFVVLYNLSYINISERRREIASLKVLGFYYSEVDNYIIKENFIITLIGITIGLLIGKPFVDVIINSIEIDLISFIHEIKINSYIYAALFMLGFTILVSIIIHFVLKKIDMIESLKSVE